jgi:hypothetical protein
VCSIPLPRDLNGSTHMESQSPSADGSQSPCRDPDFAPRNVASCVISWFSVLLGTWGDMTNRHESIFVPTLGVCMSGPHIQCRKRQGRLYSVVHSVHLCFIFKCLDSSSPCIAEDTPDIHCLDAFFSEDKSWCAFSRGSCDYGIFAPYLCENPKTPVLS